ncbi:MAG: ParB/RepB/Spo0J family partition protein [Chloroflexi bacterium]|nr:ParB/RepB/Spo0J family partition protein [Chloroflexota bacterium]
MAKKQIERTDQIFDETESVTSVFAQRQGGTQHYAPIHSVVPNRFNPRRHYSRENLEDLIQSMRTYGFIGALDGRALPDGRIELAYGSRRLLAAKSANIRAIPVFLHDWDDTQMRLLALVENLTHEDLNPVDEATTVGLLSSELGLSTRDICTQVNEPRSWVQDRLSLFRAPQDVRDMVIRRPDTLRSARFIARLPDREDRRRILEKVLRQELTTRQVQLIVQQMEHNVPADRALNEVAGREGEVTRSSARRSRIAPIAEAVLAAGDAARNDQNQLVGTEPTGVQDAESAGIAGLALDFRALNNMEIEPDMPHASPYAEGYMADQDARGSQNADHSSHHSAIPDRLDDLFDEPFGGSQLITLAIDALDGLDPQAIRSDELADALHLLRQIADRASHLTQTLENKQGSDTSIA